MKTIWKKHNFTIVLILLIYLCAFLLINQHDNPTEDMYVNLYIKEGDTLWDIATRYESESNLNREKFINWVESTNNISRHSIIAGSTIVIPIKTANNDLRTVASINDYNN